MELTIIFFGNLDGSRSLWRFSCTLQCLSFSLTRRAHLLISANHRLERFSKNDPWVIFHKLTSSSMTLSEGNRHSFRICLANERCFHIKSFSGERFSAVYISLDLLQVDLSASVASLFWPRSGRPRATKSREVRTNEIRRRTFWKSNISLTGLI